MLLADYCRWANSGYRDGQPGTEDDVKERILILEACCESYAKSLRSLHKRLDALDASS